jgi:hypothetical protein
VRSEFRAQPVSCLDPLFYNRLSTYSIALQGSLLGNLVKSV